MTDPDDTDTARHPFRPSSGDSCICDVCGEPENWHKDRAMNDSPPANQPQDTRDKGCERMADAAFDKMMVDDIPASEALKLDLGLRALVEFVWHVSLTPDNHPRLLVSEKQRALAVIKTWETGHE